MFDDLTGRRVLVTGSTQGIGLAAVEAASDTAASHADVAEHVEKLAGKAIAARRNQIDAPAPESASAPAGSRCGRG